MALTKKKKYPLIGGLSGSSTESSEVPRKTVEEAAVEKLERWLRSIEEHIKDRTKELEDLEEDKVRREADLYCFEIKRELYIEHIALLKEGRDE